MSPDFSKGLVPVVVQNAETGKVLMLAYMDEESWTKTRATGRASFHSRERGLWEKAAVAGANGYAGMTAVNLLARHPAVELTQLTSRSYAGKPYSELFPLLDLT